MNLSQLKGPAQLPQGLPQLVQFHFIRRATLLKSLQVPQPTKVSQFTHCLAQLQQLAQLGQPLQSPPPPLLS